MVLLLSNCDPPDMKGVKLSVSRRITQEIGAGSGQVLTSMVPVPSPLIADIVMVELSSCSVPPLPTASCSYKRPVADKVSRELVL